MGGVEGFDSLSGVEAAVMLSESLGVRLPEDYNPFISKDGKQALSVREIAGLPEHLRWDIGLSRMREQQEKRKAIASRLRPI